MRKGKLTVSMNDAREERNVGSLARSIYTATPYRSCSGRGSLHRHFRRTLTATAKRESPAMSIYYILPPPPSPPLHLPLNLSVSFSLFLSSTTAIRRTQQKRRIVWFPFCKSSVSFNQTCILHCRLSESWRSKRINATLMPATIYLVSIFIRNDSIPRHEFRQEFVSGEQIRLADEKIATNILTGLGTWIWQFFRSVLQQNGKWKIEKKIEFSLVTKFWTRFCWTFEEWKLVKERFGGYFCTEVEMIIIF